MKNIIISIFVLLLTSCLSETNGNSSKIIEDFFNEYKKNMETAIDNLFLTNEMIDIESEPLVNLKKQIKESVKDLGDYNGYELISSHKAGQSESLVIYSYLIKYDKQPIRFQFTLYKPKDRWMIYNFQYDSNLNEELIKSSQLFLLNNTYGNNTQ